MDCETVRPQLAESLTGASSGEALASHLEGCPGCSARLDELKALERRLDALPAVLPAFVDRELRLPIAPPARRSRTGLLAAWAGAAAALALTIYFFLAPPVPAVSAIDRLVGDLALAEGERRDELRLEILNSGPASLPALLSLLGSAPEGLRADLEELVAALQAAEVATVTVTSKDGETMRGTLVTTAFKMKTGFGETTVQVAKIVSIEFGATDVVTTREKTQIKGKILLAEFKLKTESGDAALKTANLKSIAVDGALGKLEKGKVEDGTAKNGMTYHVRLPAKYDAKKGMPAILILHGSNMNTRAYVDTIVGTWPKLAEDFVLLGVNGEKRAQGSPDDNPAFNYTYVNYAGKSKYKGYPGTDRESPALVPEVLAEIRQRVNLGKVYVGGHSQGGFLTYSLLMNTPELFAGAFPISGGLIIQAEPSAYDKPEIRAAQRKVPLAIVHGENDEAVGFGMARSAHESFLGDGFPMLRLFAHKSAGHAFGLLPVEEAVRWLESMSSDDPAALAALAEERLGAKEYREAVALAERARALDKGGKLAAKLKAVDQAVEKEAAPRAKALEKALAQAKDDSWVADFSEFRTSFEHAPCAKAVMEAYAKLRAQHEKPAEELFYAARRDFQAEKDADAYKKCEELVQKYYASSYYRYAKRWLQDRK
jgi:predicted esterase